MWLIIIYHLLHSSSLNKKQIYLIVMKMQHSNYNKMFNYSVWNTVFYVVEEIQTLSSKTYTTFKDTCKYITFYLQDQWSWTWRLRWMTGRAGLQDFPSVLLKVNADSKEMQPLAPSTWSVARSVYQPSRRYTFYFIHSFEL